MHQHLAAFYENPEVPNSFGGVEALHRSVKGKYSKKDVKHWLSQKDAYTFHKPVRHKFQRNRVFVSDIDRQFQADLVDMQSLAEFNKWYKYLLTCIDLFSKFAWAVPLKDKFGKSVQSGLEIIFKERKPKVLQTDAGQIGSGLTHYKGINFQKGYGIGGIFRRLFRAALPFLLKGGKPIGKEVLMTGSRVASDVLSGENFKEAVKTRSRVSGKKLAQKATDRVQSMVGKGQYKRKRCVDNEAVHGALSKSPYEFKHFNLNFIGVYVDGQPVPHNPLELDFSKDQYIRACQTLFVGTDRMDQDRGIFISRKEYKDSNTLFGFNLSPDLCSSGEHLSLIKHSNLRLELKFRKSLEQTVCVIVFAESFNRNKQIEKYLV
ncbi:uncharacterized protein F54H12.2 [Trichonephila clavipes]|nr:uncharacterized protein F54H12.2 [Trichonephila clavipes]